jgi:hypothetical protein
MQLNPKLCQKVLPHSSKSKKEVLLAVIDAQRLLTISGIRFYGMNRDRYVVYSTAKKIGMVFFAAQGVEMRED